MCIKQNHRFVISHSTGIGDSISPTILTLPVMNPKMSLFSASAGTTLTTGAPRLVTTTGAPVACTCFMTARQCALNAPAGICFTGFSFYPWSFYRDQYDNYSTSGFAVIRPASMPSAGITSYKPPYAGLGPRCWSYLTDRLDRVYLRNRSCMYVLSAHQAPKTKIQTGKV